MARFSSVMLEFGECVIGKLPHPVEASLDPLWQEGVWLGRSTVSGDHLVGTGVGVIQCRAVRALPAERRWDTTLFKSMVWTPWHINEKSEVGDLPTAPEAGPWTPTEGCKACEEEAEPVRRRGRPRNHTRACLQRRAERRRVQARAEGDQVAPPALFPAALRVPPPAPEQQSFPGDGQPAQEASSGSGGAAPSSGAAPADQPAAAASSSSAPSGAGVAGGDGDQSMLPEAGPKREPDARADDQEARRVRLRAKTAASATRARREADAEETSKRQRVISAIEREIAELERNEEEPDDVETELQDAWEDQLTPEKEMEIKGDELTRLEDYAVYWAVPRKDAKTRPLSLVWVIEKRSGIWKARLCARPFGKAKTRTKDQLYAPTPFPVTVRAMLIYAHLYNRKVKIFDVHRAFLHTPIQEDVWIEPPPEWPNPNDEVWHLRCTLYGLQEAMVDFDTHFDNIVQGQTTFDGYPVMSMKRCVSGPAAWYSDYVKMVKHVDDGIVVADEEPMEDFLHDLQKYFQLKINEYLEVGVTQKYLGGLITRYSTGFFQQCLPQHYESLFSMLGLENGSAVVTPGDKSDSKREGEKELPHDETRLFRRAQGTALFIAQFRPDMMYASKECSRGMKTPTEGDMRRLKRWTRYALGTRYVGIMMRPQ